MDSFGVQFHRLRLKLQLSQTQAAQVLRVSPMSVSRWERETVVPYNTWYQDSVLRELKKEGHNADPTNRGRRRLSSL